MGFLVVTGRQHIKTFTKFEKVFTWFSSNDSRPAFDVTFFQIVRTGLAGRNEGGDIGVFDGDQVEHGVRG